MVADPNVIVAVRQSYNNLEWYPGITPPNAEAIRQIYDDASCHMTVQHVDAKQVAASVDTGLVWIGFMLGLSVAVLALIVINARIRLDFRSRS
jgi:cell division protein FtsX